LFSKNYPINDRNNTLEAAIEILSQLRPENQDFVTTASQSFVDGFYVILAT
jgi:hypothetical protein